MIPKPLLDACKRRERPLAEILCLRNPGIDALHCVERRGFGTSNHILKADLVSEFMVMTTRRQNWNRILLTRIFSWGTV